MKTLTKEEVEQLFNEAVKASNNAHCPYSNFPVGAALMGDDGKIYTGCNVENASYGLTICAERTAIFKAISEGCKHIEAIMIVATKGHHTPPCGACRTVIDEFIPKGEDIPVIFGENFNELIYTTAKTLYTADF